MRSKRTSEKIVVLRNVISSWSQLLFALQVSLIILLSYLVAADGSSLKLSIGFVSTPQDHLSLQSQQEIRNAFEMAVNEANALGHLPENVTLAMTFHTVQVNHSVSAALEEMMRSGAVTAFGHADVCNHLTSALKSRNRIAISNVCGDEKLSNKDLFPAFLRTRPPDSQMVESILALLQHYDWNSISVVVENTTKWRATALSLERRTGHKEGLAGHRRNITTIHRIYFNDNRLCCALKQPCCYVAWPHDIFQKMKSSTKIFIFLGEKISLRKFVQAIEDLEQWRANQYLVISCDSEAFSTSWSTNFLQPPRIEKMVDENNNWDTDSVLTESRKFNAYSKLVENTWLPNTPQAPKHTYSKEFRAKTTPGNIMIIRNIANEQLKSFTRRLRLFSSQKHPIDKDVVSLLPSSIYAAYAYDAIMVYTHALAFHVKKHGSSRNSVMEAALNGSLLFNTILEIQNFSSVRGGFISFNANGDTEDSYIAVGSSNLFPPRFNSSVDVHTNVMVPFGFFRGTIFHPTSELNHTLHTSFAGSESNSEDQVIYDVELLNDNVNMTIIVAHLLTLAAMVYLFTHQARKLAAKMDILTINVAISTDAELSSHLLNVKQMRVMNYPLHPNKVVDDWRMKVWNKSIKWTSSWPALDCETIGEIRQMRRLQHENINPFICAIVEPARICIITEFQSRKSLMDVLSTSNNDLNCKLIASLALDLVKGMLYIHSSDLRCHGNLKSANCLLDSNWTLKVADFGLHKLRNAAKDSSKNERDYYFDLLWTAPEILRKPSLMGTPEGDVYSFAVILHEMACRQGPFAIYYDLGDPARIISQIKHTVRGCQIPARPPIESLDCRLAYMFPCMVDCWIEDPNERPNFSSVLHYLTKLGGVSTDFTYKKTLASEDVCIDEEKRALEEEIQNIDEVLHRIIPKSVANCLANGLPVEAELWENVTVFEADLVGFTEIASETTPLGTMILLDDVYTLFDSIARGYDVCKIGTIGDAYIVVSGMQPTHGKNSAGEIASMALEVVEKMKGSGIGHRGKPLVVRIGVHTGDLVTGVVGSTIMPTYSIFGDTVSVASRLESTSSELRIQISEASYQELQQIGGYITEERTDRNEAAESFKTYWLIGKTSKAVQRREKDCSSVKSLCNRQSVISLTSTDIYIDHSIDDDPSNLSSP
ncbi:receptor-type guanylate cyclase Gyc76C-like [Daphnia carinata]|uniref:receptor-type guanylate cyclase Gyc76C-like n=1 Tax=Daphnia carinata TaxID=120202 RepID=UPI0025799FE4|nr:receptor-type guanylate cyclase Gyc76C-like [Daphnia carinata]